MEIVKFTCPKCKKCLLEFAEEVLTSHPIFTIYENGEYEYNYGDRIEGDANLIGFRCFHCGYELLDDKGNSILKGKDVVKWIQNHCPQGPAKE